MSVSADELQWFTQKVFPSRKDAWKRGRICEDVGALIYRLRDVCLLDYVSSSIDASRIESALHEVEWGKEWMVLLSKGFTPDGWDDEDFQEVYIVCPQLLEARISGDQDTRFRQNCVVAVDRASTLSFAIMSDQQKSTVLDSACNEIRVALACSRSSESCSSFPVHTRGYLLGYPLVYFEAGGRLSVEDEQTFPFVDGVDPLHLVEVFLSRHDAADLRSASTGKPAAQHTWAFSVPAKVLDASLELRLCIDSFVDRIGRHLVSERNVVVPKFML